MSLQPGAKLGPYEIVAEVGAGGMGQVWRGRDTRLERDVAIKVLPEAIAHSEQALARFEREARTISSLNHPHICTLFDVGHEGGTHFLVMELIEGESLAERLSRGALPLAEVLRYGSQIADALDAAHRQGIVHRDLKPANIMFTRAGTKLLDFGLARPAAESSPVSGLTAAATRATPLTAEGTIVGTFQYMSPEQLEGLEADARSDIFALGAVLYEMATGRPAFDAATKTSLIAAIVTAQPAPISTVAGMCPPALDHIVAKCLEKDPDERWQSARDVAGQLRWLGEAGSQAGVATAVVARRRMRRSVLTALALTGWLAALALGGWALSRSLGPAPVQSAFHSELVAPPGVDLGSVVVGTIALSPDGGRLAFSGREDETSLLLRVRDLTTGEVVPLAGTEGAGFPFWSQDGRWLAFFSDQKLKKVSSTGGPVQIVAEAQAGRGGTWNADGTMLFAPDIQGPLVTVSDSGGRPRPATTPPTEHVTHRNPHFLPDGEHFLFTERESRNQAHGDISVASLGGGESKVVVEKASNPQYAGGYLFFARDGNLVARAFDLGALEVRGPLLPIAEGIEYYNPRDIGNFSVSENLLVYHKRSVAKSRLAWFDRTGRVAQSIGEAAFYSAVSDVSADGKLVALVRVDESGNDRDIWIMDLEREQLTRSTFLSTSGAISAAFSPDGDRLAVTSFVGVGWAGSAAWIQTASGGGGQETLIESSSFLVTDWSRDGKYLIGVVQETDTAHDVVYVELDGTPEIVKIVGSRYTEREGLLSPDGKWLCYESDESGRTEIYLTDFPQGTQKWQVSKSGGSAALWSEDGQTLIYVAENRGVYQVSMGGNDRLQIGEPKLIIDSSLIGENWAGPPVAVHGDLTLAVELATAPLPEPLRLIQNWRVQLDP